MHHYTTAGPVCTRAGPLPKEVFLVPRQVKRLVLRGPEVTLSADNDIPLPVMVGYIRQFYPDWQELDAMPYKQVAAIFHRTRVRWEQQCVQDFREELERGGRKQLALF